MNFKGSKIPSLAIV